MYLNGILSAETDILGAMDTISPMFEFGYTIFSIVVSLALFVLKGVAIYTMGKRRNFDKLWMAYVPFLNYVLLGKIIGEVVIWGKKVKNIGLLTCIFTAISVIIGYVVDVGYYVYILEQAFKVDFIFNSAFINDWVMQKGLVWLLVSIVGDVCSIINIILTCWMIFLIFRKYAPERSFMYSLLAIFFDFTFPILLFIVRNNEVVTFEDFLRQRNRYYTQNPNQNGGYNGYGAQTPPANEVDPFPEFSNKPQNTNNGDPSENPYETTEKTVNNNSNDDDLFS